MSEIDGWVEIKGVWTKQIDISDSMLAKIAVSPKHGLAKGVIFKKTLTPTGKEILEPQNQMEYHFEAQKNNRDVLRHSMEMIEAMALSRH